MEAKKFTFLESELTAQWREIEKIYDRIEERKRKRGTHGLESLAYQLHNLYCAYEDLFGIVASFFENTVEDSLKYHTELLKRMRLEIAGVRPALLSEESFQLLSTLHSFRHFFRHAYSYELDRRKVSIVLADALKLKEVFQSDFGDFLAKLP